jgi:hypothetical protein
MLFQPKPEQAETIARRLLDTLDYQVAVRDAHVRWPNWTFTRSYGWWRAKQTDGPELLTGRTLEQVEGRVAQWERMGSVEPAR